MTQELKRGLVEFGVAHPPRLKRAPLAPRDFVRLYFSCPREAYIWQEYYSDRDDDDELMQLLRKLRAATANHA